MDGLLKSLFGESFKMGSDGIMGMLGNEGVSNLIKGIGTGMNMFQTGDMMDFQKGLANKADARTQGLYDRDQREQDALNNLDFTATA